MCVCVCVCVCVSVCLCLCCIASSSFCFISVSTKYGLVAQLTVFAAKGLRKSGLTISMIVYGAVCLQLHVVYAERQS